MGRFLIPILIALALPNAVEAFWWGKYRSKAEAKRACEYWARNGISYKLNTIDGVITKYVRRCRHEMVTRQFLGVNAIDIKKLKKLNSYKRQIPVQTWDEPSIYDQHIKYFEY